MCYDVSAISDEKIKRIYQRVKCIHERVQYPLDTVSFFIVSRFVNLDKDRKIKICA